MNALHTRTNNILRSRYSNTIINIRMKPENNKRPPRKKWRKHSHFFYMCADDLGEQSNAVTPATSIIYKWIPVNHMIHWQTKANIQYVNTIYVTFILFKWNVFEKGCCFPQPTINKVFAHFLCWNLFEKLFKLSNCRKKCFIFFN